MQDELVQFKCTKTAVSRCKSTNINLYSCNQVSLIHSCRHFCGYFPAASFHGCNQVASYVASYAAMP